VTIITGTLKKISSYARKSRVELELDAKDKKGSIRTVRVWYQVPDVHAEIAELKKSPQQYITAEGKAEWYLGQILIRAKRIGTREVIVPE